MHRTSWAAALVLSGAILEAGVITASPAPLDDAPASLGPTLPSQCTGDAPIVCNFAVSPGNYEVTVDLGDQGSAGMTGVQAEARRVILPPVATQAGQLLRYSFTVNVRTPEAQPTGQGGRGVPGLNLVFSGPAPRLAGISYTPAPSTPVLYLIGDSTVCDQPAAPLFGWGQLLPQYFGPGVSVANHSDSGESSVSFLAEAALFPSFRSAITTGDTVLIQLGHNDRTTTEETYTANLRTLVRQVREQGGIPVLVTPPVRRLFTTSGELTSEALHEYTPGVDLVAAMRGVAASQGVPLIDLTARSEGLVESLGPDDSARLYLTPTANGVTDNTHFSAYGADQLARMVVEALRIIDLPVARFLR